MISHNNDVSYIVSQKYTFISNKKYFLFLFFFIGPGLTVFCLSFYCCFLSFLLFLFFVFPFIAVFCLSFYCCFLSFLFQSTILTDNPILLNSPGESCALFTSFQYELDVRSECQTRVAFTLTLQVVQTSTRNIHSPK